jgi:microcystin-dependent protein
MSSLVTNPASQFINPYLGNICENAKIYIGLVNTDALNPDNRQPVYLMQWSDEATVNKVPIPQPLLTNSAGCIVYQGLPVTPWVDGAYSITIIGYDGAQLYQSFYVDDPTYWLRLDLATEPTRTDDGLHYNPDDIHGINMIGGGAPILSPDFEGEPRAPTPLTGDSSTRIATTEFVNAAVLSVANSGAVGELSFWLGSTPPANAVVADGSALSKEDYAELYAVIGDTVATENDLTPDSATFFIPDMRSRYPRGTDNGASRSTNAALLKYYEGMVEEHGHGIWFGEYRADGNTHNSGSDLLGHSQEEDFKAYSEVYGGTETMPMTVPFLPIIWISSGTVTTTVSVWWQQPEYASSRPLVHHYHEETGELLGSSPTNPSPHQPGAWLTPAHATQQNPLPAVPGHVMRFRNGAWGQDAQLFAERLANDQKSLLRQKQDREARNHALMEIGVRKNKLELMDKWAKVNGAPYTISELLQHMKVEK